MRFVFGLAGGIDHQEQVITEIRHHQIVENAAGIVGELRIALAAGRNRDNVLRDQRFERAGGVFDLAGFRRERDLPHVGDIEQAGGGAGVEMFLQHAGGVLHRHLVACEGHDLAAARHMQIVQRNTVQRSFGGVWFALSGKHIQGS